jgi:hypothetical protein
VEGVGYDLSRFSKAVEGHNHILQTSARRNSNMAFGLKFGVAVGLAGRIPYLSQFSRKLEGFRHDSSQFSKVVEGHNHIMETSAWRGFGVTGSAEWVGRLVVRGVV